MVRIANCASGIPCSCSTKVHRVKSCRQVDGVPRVRRRRRRFHAKVLTVGGESLGEPADRPYGERTGFIRDAYGNRCYIASPLGPEPFAHALRAVTPFLHSRDVRGYIDFLVRAFGASEEVVHELPGGNIPYARARLGDAAIELGTADPTSGAFCLYVAEPDAVHEQAFAAGARALSPPVDQPSGDRMAFVEDALGNQWYITRPALRLRWEREIRGNCRLTSISTHRRTEAPDSG
jgi:uncharacterized glyoxalase superfamily protein PhnB